MGRDGPGALGDLATAFLTLVCIVVLGTAVRDWLGVSGVAEWIVGIAVVVLVVGVMLVGYWVVFLSDADSAA